MCNVCQCKSILADKNIRNIVHSQRVAVFDFPICFRQRSGELTSKEGDRVDSEGGDVILLVEELNAAGFG